MYACPVSDPVSDPDGLNAAPYCIRCGPRGPDLALCLSAPEVPSYCIDADAATNGGDGGGEEEEDDGDDSDV